jgi:hypothetical protein
LSKAVVEALYRARDYLFAVLFKVVTPFEAVAGSASGEQVW